MKPERFSPTAKELSNSPSLVEDNQLRFDVCQPQFEGATGTPHFGRVDTPAGMMVFFCTNLSNRLTDTQPCPEAGGTVTGTLSAADVLAIQGQKVTAGDFDALTDALLSNFACVKRAHHELCWWRDRCTNSPRPRSQVETAWLRLAVSRQGRAEGCKASGS